MREPLLFDVSKSETFKLVHEGHDVLIYEGGWWMKRSDYDRLYNVSVFDGRPIRIKRHDIGISRDEKTRQLTTFVIFNH